MTVTTGRCALIDPAPGGLGQYEWQTNYDTEENFGRTRSVEAVPTTDESAHVIQQGEESPLVKRISGTILYKNQHAKFAAFFKKCRTNTLVFHDFDGEEYEVVITSYLPAKTRTLRNPKDPTIPLHYYKYSLEMQVIRVISGVWA